MKKFVMYLEPHKPEGNKPCYECVLLSGPMCLDRRYCQFRETGLTWKKCINQSELDNSEY
jgi:hypothetical protein